MAGSLLAGHSLCPASSGASSFRVNPDTRRADEAVGLVGMRSVGRTPRKGTKETDGYDDEANVAKVDGLVSVVPAQHDVL